LSNAKETQEASGSDLYCGLSGLNYLKI